MRRSAFRFARWSPHVVAMILATTGLASTASADGSSLPYGRGGMRFPEMNAIIARYNASGELFRIEGNCRSSCTELLAIKKVCVDPSATLQFHAALADPAQPVDHGRNMRMASYYNPKLRAYVLANHYMDSWDFHDISGADIVSRFGYRPCPAR
jgi:hypothetical protein